MCMQHGAEICTLYLLARLSLATDNGALINISSVDFFFSSFRSNYKMSHLPSEPEFEQAYNELVYTLKDSTLFEQRPELERLLDVVSIPERVVQFRVVWEDDSGKLQVNRGYRVQFNSALGPYKGGLRFHPTVNLSVLKFLGFEQIFKNALTSLNMGGGKGGSDFDPKGRSNNEIRRFCQAFMTELSRHIGSDTDVPAGDIGVTGVEIGYLFGQYKRLQNRWGGVLTGKNLNWGGSLIRPEATGYGVVYFVERMIEMATQGLETFKGKRVLISGSGNVAQYAALKVVELGGIVLSMSDSVGTLMAKDEVKGFNAMHIQKIIETKAERKPLTTLLDDPYFAEMTWHEGKRPWMLTDKVYIALPCATQNEVSKEEAEHLVKAGCKFVAEGSNMGSTIEAIEVFERSRPHTGIWYAPGKAANCGGVAVSGLEMAQNSTRSQWTTDKVDQRLKEIMVNCFYTCVNTSKAYAKHKEELPSLVRGANIAGFVKVADAMIDQGDFY